MDQDKKRKKKELKELIINKTKGEDWTTGTKEETIYTATTQQSAFNKLTGPEQIKDIDDRKQLLRV